MIALPPPPHHESIARFAAAFSGRPLVFSAVRGRSLRDSAQTPMPAHRCGSQARLVVLQEMGSGAGSRLRVSTRVIYPSRRPFPSRAAHGLSRSCERHLREIMILSAAPRSLAHLPRASRIPHAPVRGERSPYAEESALAARDPR